MIPFKLTNYSLQHLFKHTVPVILLFGINITNVGAAATPSIPAETENRPGTLVSQPLHTSATAEPNIVFLLDNSGSMNSNLTSGGVTKTRLNWLKDALHTIVPELNGVRVGM